MPLLSVAERPQWSTLFIHFSFLLRNHLFNLHKFQRSGTHMLHVHTRPVCTGCAVAPGRMAVGLDVERLGRVPKGGKLMALARRRFAAAECAALEGVMGCCM